jgi:hypothetical protein
MANFVGESNSRLLRAAALRDLAAAPEMESSVKLCYSVAHWASTAVRNFTRSHASSGRMNFGP